MIELERLIALSLGEGDAGEREETELHVFSCTGCANTLTRLLRTGEGLRFLVGHGQLPFFVSGPRLKAMTERGLVTRTYRLAPGEQVACSVSAEDVYVASVLDADLHGVEQVDAQVDDFPRLTDVPFDEEGGAVTFLQGRAMLQGLPAKAVRVTLFGRSGEQERALGTYVFDHAKGAG